MHWWSHWSRKWLWALDAELWSWNMCRCWCRSVGWCEDHTYSSYANLVGIHSFRHSSSSAKQHSLNSNSWWTIGGTSPHPLSAFRHLPKSFSWSPKFLCSSTHLPPLSTSPPKKNRWKFCHQPSPMRSFSCPGLRDLTPFCQAAGHAPSKGHRRDKRAPSAAVPVTFFPAWMKRPVFFQGKVWVGKVVTLESTWEDILMDYVSDIYETMNIS